MILPPAEQAEWDAVIDAEVAAAPPLSPEQIARLTALFDYQLGNP
jgi:F0F1-type ATP synthase delta subunit